MTAATTETEVAPKMQMPPEAAIMQMVLGAWVSQAISAVTRLNIPDLLKAKGPSTAKELAMGREELNAEFLERVLRACASVGVFAEFPDGRFDLTPLSETLTADSPVSRKKMVELFGASWWRVWSGLEQAIRTGEPQSVANLGSEYWDYMDANPKEMEDFGLAMKSNSLNSIRWVLERCDFSRSRVVADVAGGFGHLAIGLLEKYPHLRAIVLEVPKLVPIAKQQWKGMSPGTTSRLEFVAGNMFESVPRADTYIMKHIIHDWDDERCAKLLRNCRNAMEGNGRVICVDSVIPPMGDTGAVPAKFLDLNMLVMIHGKERTLKQWEALFGASGLRLDRVTELDAEFGVSILESVKA
jgi:hypothetical protein